MKLSRCRFIIQLGGALYTLELYPSYDYQLVMKQRIKESIKFEINYQDVHSLYNWATLRNN